MKHCPHLSADHSFCVPQATSLLLTQKSLAHLHSAVLLAFGDPSGGVWTHLHSLCFGAFDWLNIGRGARGAKSAVVCLSFWLCWLPFFPESVCEGFFVKNICKTMSHLHLHIFTSAHLHLCSPSHLHLHLCSSSHLHICTSTFDTFAHLHLCSS